MRFTYVIQPLLLAIMLLACNQANTPQVANPRPPAVPIWQIITPGDGQIYLSWLANHEADLDHYRLYWGTQSGSLPNSESIPKDNTDFILANLENETRYFLALTAVNELGKASNMSIELGAVPTAPSLPPAPPVPDDSDFSISGLESLSIQKGETKALPFSIARNNFDAEIVFNLKDAPTGISSDLPKGTTEDVMVASLNVEDGEALIAGNYTLEFQATAKGISKIVVLKLTVLDNPLPPPPPVAGSFSVAVPASLNLEQGKSGTLEFSFLRTDFPDPITLTMLSGIPGISTADLPANSAGNNMMIKLDVAGAVALGSYELDFEATAKGLSQMVTVILSVAKPTLLPAPSINTVSLEGLGSSKQLRQGQSNAVLRVLGTGLMNVTNVTFSVPVTWEILENTNTLLRVKVSVPHGASPGPVQLSLKTAGGSDSVANAIIISYITAAGTGNDASGNGTADLPFRSLTKAVSVATAKDEIRLLSGTFSPARGEAFPIDVSGLTIVGVSNDKSVISGADNEQSCLIVSTAGITTLRDLWVRSCNTGIQLEQGTSQLLRIRSSDHKNYGLYAINEVQASIQDSLFSANGASGIVALGSAKLTIGGNGNTKIYDNGAYGINLITNAGLTASKLQVYGNSRGLRMIGSGTTATLETSWFYNNTLDGISVENSQQLSLTDVTVELNKQHGLYITGDTNLSLIGSKVRNNDADGINVNVSATKTAVLTINTSVISFNGESGLEYRSANTASKLFMTNSIVENNSTHGLYLAGKPATIQLGFLKPGNNLFRDNGTTFLTDARDANSGTIYAVGTGFMIAGAAINESGLKHGPQSKLPLWSITHAGNAINFGSLLP